MYILCNISISYNSCENWHLRTRTIKSTLVKLAKTNDSSISEFLIKILNNEFLYFIKICF